MTQNKPLPPLVDPKRIASLAQNIVLCMKIKKINLDDFEAEVDMEPGTIKHWLAGKGAVAEDTLRSISAYFDLSAINLLGTNGPEDRRREAFTHLLEQELSSHEPIRNFGRRRDAFVDVDDLLENPLSSRPATRSTGEPRHHISVQDSTEATNDEITWDETGTVACVEGRYIDLIKKEVRIVVARNVFDHNPFKPVRKLTDSLRPAKNANWLYNLKAGQGRIDRNILEQIATLCKTSVLALLGRA